MRSILISYKDDLKQKIENGGGYQSTEYNPFEVLTCAFAQFKICFSNSIFIIILSFFVFFAITDILDDYDKFCNTTEQLSQLIGNFHTHLSQFALSWTTLNKRVSINDMSICQFKSQCWSVYQN